MISLVIGMPRSGKTTLVAKMALEVSRQIDQGIGKYNHVYTNVELKGIPHCTRIKFSDCGKYMIRDALVIIDEATLDADSRSFKNFSQAHKEFVMLNGHFNISVYFLFQQFGAVDLKIRSVADAVFYIYKPFILGRWISRLVRVPYRIIFPSKRDTGEKWGDIVNGYAKPPWYARLFSRIIFRPKYYQYFDSFWVPNLPPLPPPNFDIAIGNTVIYVPDVAPPPQKKSLALPVK